MSSIDKYLKASEFLKEMASFFVNLWWRWISRKKKNNKKKLDYLKQLKGKVDVKWNCIIVWEVPSACADHW